MVSSLCLITTWFVEAALKFEDNSRLLKLLGLRCPSFWQRVLDNKIWYLTLQTLDNILLNEDKVYKVFASSEDFLISFTNLIEDILRRNPFIFCGSSKSYTRYAGMKLLWSLHSVLDVTDQKRKLTTEPVWSAPKAETPRGDTWAKKTEEDLKVECVRFWSKVVDDSEGAFVEYVRRVLDARTLDVLKNIRNVIKENVLPDRSRLEAFFDRGWEDYVHSDDRIFQGLIEIRKNHGSSPGITEDILVDVIYFMHMLERKEIVYPSKIPLLNRQNNKLYLIETDQDTHR